MPNRGAVVPSLAQLLRRCRVGSGLTVSQLAEIIGISHPYLSRIESGDRRPGIPLIHKIMEATNADDDMVRRILDLRTAMTGYRRATHSLVPSQTQERLLRLQAEAQTVRGFSPLVIPGMLQTRAYALGIAHSGGLEGHELQRWLANRLKQGHVLAKNPSQQYTYIMPWAALGWCPISTEDMIKQLEHIDGLIQFSSALNFGIIPWGRELPQLYENHSFILYDDDVCMASTSDTTALFGEHKRLHIYIDAMDKLIQVAEFGEAARQMLQTAIHAYSYFGWSVTLTR